MSRRAGLRGWAGMAVGTRDSCVEVGQHVGKCARLLVESLSAT